MGRCVRQHYARDTCGDWRGALARTVQTSKHVRRKQKSENRKQKSTEAKVSTAPIRVSRFALRRAGREGGGAYEGGGTYEP